MMKRITNQNHRTTKIFSLTMFNDMKHKVSISSILPEAPNLWNVHLTTLGNILTSGSSDGSFISTLYNSQSKPNRKK